MIMFCARSAHVLRPFWSRVESYGRMNIHRAKVALRVKTYENPALELRPDLAEGKG